MLTAHSHLSEGVKNASHEMAIVREPCNLDAHTKISTLFITMFCPRCAHVVCTHVLYNCTHWLWLYSILLTNQSIASIQGTPHTHHMSHMTHTWLSLDSAKHFSIVIFPYDVMYLYNQLNLPFFFNLNLLTQLSSSSGQSLELSWVYSWIGPKPRCFSFTSRYL